MSRKLVLVMVVGIFAMTSVGDASALTFLKPWSSWTGSDQTSLENYIGGNGGPAPVNPAEDLSTGIGALQAESGAVDLSGLAATSGAILEVASGAAVLTTAGVLAYQLARPTFGPWVSRMIFGRAPPNVTVSDPAGFEEWYKMCPTSVPPGFPGTCSSGLSTGVFFYNTPNTLAGASGCSGLGNGAGRCDTSGGVFMGNGVLCTDTFHGNCSFLSSTYAGEIGQITAANPYIKKYYNVGSSSPPGQGTIPGSSMFAFVDTGDFAKAFRQTDISPGQYNGLSGGQKFGTLPLSTPGATPTGNALATLNCMNPTAQTPDQIALCDFLGQKYPNEVGGTSTVVTCSNCSSGSSFSGFSPFVIPEPQNSEDYRGYISRLRDKGLVGTVTINTIGSDSPLTGPNGVYSVEDTTAGLGPNTINPSWPANALTVSAAADAITVVVNSSAAPEVPPNACSTCAIDWTPLEALSLGSKFPFGIPSWIASVFPTFTSSCPSLSIGKPAALGGGSISIPWCSTEWETTYRPIIFPILQILIVIAGVVFLAGKLTGIGDTDTDGG